MNSKHTPGPWAVYRPASDETVYEGGDSPATIRAGEIHVATMPGERPNLSPTQAANARLIAASPCLLSALEACRDAIQRLAKESPDGVPVWASAAHDSARLAIAKATGTN